MNYVKFTRLAGVAAAAALSMTASHSWAASDSYKFEAPDKPAGMALTVHLVDQATRQPVQNARVFAIHRQWQPTKGVPRHIDRQIELVPNGDGAFTYESNDVQAGATIRLCAEIGDPVTTDCGSVVVGS